MVAARRCRGGDCLSAENPNANLRRRLERLAWLLDSSIRIPVVGWRIGLDSLIGLIPGVGDALGGLVSTYILAQGVRLRASKATLARMLFNVALEFFAGLVPVAGDLFDMGFKSNQRNVELLQAYLDDSTATARGSRRRVALFAVAMTLAGVVAIGVSLWVLRWAIGLIGGLF